LHIHGSDVHRNLQVPILAQITQLAIRGAEFVFYSTPNLESFVGPLREDAVYLPNPVMPYRESQGTVQVHRGGVRILLFMRLDPIKISDEFLHPLADLAKRTDIEVNAIRWGTMVEKVEKEYSSIRLISMIPHFEIYDLLSNYDIVIGQMNLGILSLSELEAMLAGKPVIVNFNYPGAYAEPPPILHAKTVEEFMANLEGLILHPKKRKELGSLGRRWVERNHDLETISRTLLGFYRKAIDSRR
jgi:glycosyltransferase involved in cell wall biosynthesis